MMVMGINGIIIIQKKTKYDEIYIYRTKSDFQKLQV